MSEKVKVSIVVPIYNVEKYVAECVASCQAQTMKEIEIICVDDGSTDRSVEIVKKIAQKDPRVICISKKNAGYGNSMNIGFDRATGEYVAIAESDDYIEPDMCEILYKTAKTYDLDVVKSDYYTFQTHRGKTVVHYENTCTDLKYYNQVLIPKKDKEIFMFQMNTWTGIYSNSFIRENHIRHNETPGASYQDNGFWFQTLSLANAIMFVNKAFYHYRQDNPNSSINSKGKVFCINDEYAYIHDFIMQHEDVKENFMQEFFKKRFFNYMHNYERIADEFKLQYLERFSKELKESEDNKEINFAKLNDEWIASVAMRIMDDYQLFYYEDQVWRVENKVNETYQRLEKLRNSKEMVEGREKADKILRILKKA